MNDFDLFVLKQLDAQSRARNGAPGRCRAPAGAPPMRLAVLLLSAVIAIPFVIFAIFMLL